ncbi:rhodanese-like domain-containing protein [Cryobacterium sp. PH31-O1]|uniref:rhodanese-like domain-containing protein n=1 Tax=Cryobacterium sp. PH31-O1 TaxID=3046306 RepID=UPI0024B896B9|nr:rhodanese-like domain-containing protein [Cryobacterium sp. PH31-O1]MDJ0339269.1 rhodanese-like domain-containing protein [Cryobacterium sp. PH31-O1]
MKKTLAALAIAVTVVLGLAACSVTAEPVELAAGTVIVDVRTPSEYAAGHLDGAVNIDVQSATFDVDLSALPADGEYVVYCASGNRSASAVARMTDLGFTGLTDAHGMSDAAASTGLAIVTAP